LRAKLDRTSHSRVKGAYQAASWVPNHQTKADCGGFFLLEDPESIREKVRVILGSAELTPAPPSGMWYYT